MTNNLPCGCANRDGGPYSPGCGALSSMRLAVYSGHHATRPDSLPDFTVHVDEFVTANRDALAVDEHAALYRGEIVRLGGGAWAAFTVFPDPDCGPGNEGVEA